MRILIRTDASIDIGSGHLMRCLTLADQLRAENADILFVCRDLPGEMFELLRARGYQSAKLSLPDNTNDSAHIDADETIKAVKQFFPNGLDWLIVDHYQLDIAWEQRLRPFAHKLMVIDDLANRRHDCEVLLDQNYESPERYRNLVNENCYLLLGPHFALLRPEYAAYRKSMKSRDREARRVLVFFGGTDQYNMTGLSLQALSQSEFCHLDVDLVIGSNYQHREKLISDAAKRPRTTIHGPRPHLADLMAEADLALGAGGATNWERMSLGLPSLVITIAENQVLISQLLNSEGAIRLLGDSREVSVENIRNSLSDEIKSLRALTRSEISMKKCDGLGVSRVIEALSTRLDRLN